MNRYLVVWLRYALSATALAVLLVTVMTGPVAADDEEYDCIAAGTDYPRCLTGNIPSYLVYADDGEEHMEFSLSIKYPLWGRDQENALYFAYTGVYDFYIFTRDSAPVVSRLQSPGIFYQRKLKDEEAYGLKRYRIGWYHESNGQHIETQDEFDATEEAIDHVSRGWDYLGLDLKYKFPFKSSYLDVYTSFNLYCDCQGLGFIDEREDEIFWKSVDDQPDVRDYNGLKAILDYTTQGRIRYVLTMRTGTRNLDALSNFSYKLKLVYRAGDVPITLFYYDGYGINLSTYHERDSYYGIGFEFW